MRPETIALHAGYDCDPATKAVAVPIYQTVAYAFDSAEHGAALFDLEVEGFRYTRINNLIQVTSGQYETSLTRGIQRPSAMPQVCVGVSAKRRLRNGIAMRAT